MDLNIGHFWRCRLPLCQNECSYKTIHMKGRCSSCREVSREWLATLWENNKTNNRNNGPGPKTIAATMIKQKQLLTADMKMCSTLHEASVWNRGMGELASGLLDLVSWKSVLLHLPYCFFYFSLYSCHILFYSWSFYTGKKTALFFIILLKPNLRTNNRKIVQGNDP